MLSKVVAKSVLDLTNVEAAILKAFNAMEEVSVHLYHTWKGCLGPWMELREKFRAYVLHLLRLQGKCLKRWRDGLEEMST